MKALLVLAFLESVAQLYALPQWASLAVFALWAGSLVPDFWTWIHLRHRPTSTLALHRRGFFLLDAGLFTARVAALVMALGVSRVAAAAGFPFWRFFGVLLTWLRGWFGSV